MKDKKDTIENPPMLQPENHNKKYESLFVEIDTGQIKLPMFQRDFVWEKEQSARLIDSILKGFPIGTFIFWKTREELRSHKEIGNHRLPNKPKGEYAQYILDGQQRITSLYAIRKGIRITKDGQEIDYQDIYIDLDAPTDSDEPLVTTNLPADIPKGKYISAHRLLTCQLTDLLDEFEKEKLKKIETHKGKLINYDFSTITIKDYPIEIACEVFSRINTGGKPLTIFEIMVAKTYDENRKFDLVEKYESLCNGSNNEKNCLASAKFETLPASLIMQCVSAVTQRAVRGKDILKITRDTFISNWQPMSDSLFTAIDFIRTELRIPASQLLPYPAIIVPLTYYFFITKNKKPTSKQRGLLEQFFYWAGLTERYGSSSDSKINEDLNKIDKIIKGKPPEYLKQELTIQQEDISERIFSPGNAYCKAILCLYAYTEPKSFDTNGTVILDNSNLKIASSRNYHHFFPKKYLEDEFPEHEANLIANITLIDGYSNKHRIGKKPPSVYIEEFSADNKHMARTLKSHLIQNKLNYGVTTDDYDKFITKRSKAIAGELNKKLNPL